MGRISSTTGVFSGLNTGDIIDKLISLESRPRDLVQQRIDGNTTIKTALLGLSAKLLGLQGSITAFRSNNVLNARTASVSDTSALRVTATASAALGSTQFRAIRQAQSQRLVSAGLTDVDSTPVGAGTITVKQGGFVGVDTLLETLNGGAGVPLGKIRITNRAGTQTVVDLSAVRTIGDVIRKINGTSGVGVVASAAGDQVLLTDSTGQTTTAISVADIDGNTTGAALGLVGGSFSGNALTGADVIGLTGSTRLSLLNDGLGVQVAAGSDFRITLRDGSTIDVDLAANASTIQDVVDAINNDSENSGSLVASIDPGGNGLRLTDSSGGMGTLAVSALNGSTAAKDLGILGAEQGGGVLTGRRLLAGFGSVLLRNLNGGAGIATLGTVQFTDRSGATASVDFSNAGSLSDVVDLINGAGLGITAALNAANNGIKLTDTTGSTVSNLFVADSSGTVAADLNLTTNTATTLVNSGDLNLRYIGENTRLERLNGGAGVQKGRLKITDSQGISTIVNLSVSSIRTVGDVIQTINASGVGVIASLNATGDGILLTDTAGGGAALKVEENGGRIAKDLNLLGTATAGQIDGAYRATVAVDADDTVNDVVAKLAAAGAPLTVAVTNDGSTLTPFHVAIGSTRSGAAGRLLIDTGGTGLNFNTVADGVDALLQLGSTENGGVPQLFSSSTNTFSQALTGVTIDLLSASDSPVTVTIGQNSQSIVDAFTALVNGFNGVVSTIKSATKFDTNTNQRGTLFGDSLTLQIESTLYRTIGRTFGSGAITTLSQLGISLKEGNLQVDSAKLNDMLAADPTAVQDFLKTTSTGFADTVDAQLNIFTERFSGQIARRVQFLDDENTDSQNRYDRLTAQLDSRRTILESQFRAMEQAFAALQSQQTALTQLASFASSLQSSSTSTRK